MRFKWTIEGVEGIEQNRELGDGWRILGDANIELVIGSVGADQFAGSTKCVKVMVKVAPNTDLAVIACAVSIQHESNPDQIRHASFFRGGPFRWSELMAGRVAIPNKCGDGLNMGVGRGGLCYLERLESKGVAETVDERKAVCATCPEDLFTGDACEGLKCCKKKTPDPARWQRAIEIGHCPRGHFGGDLGTTLVASLMPGAMIIGGMQIPTM